MRSITYLSSATKAFDTDELAELLADVRPKNHGLGLTGILLYRSGRIIQTLEGEDQDVLGVFDKIIDDPRHENVFVVVNEPIQDRMFPDWSMGFRNVTDLPEADLEGFSTFMNDDSSLAFTDEGATITRRMLELFRAGGV